MGLIFVNKEMDYIYNRKYNVEYELGNGKIGTFSNILQNVDSEYFWFSSPEDGMDVIKQNSIRTMICLDKNKVIKPFVGICEVCGESIVEDTGETFKDDCHKYWLCDTCVSKQI